MDVKKAAVASGGLSSGKNMREETEYNESECSQEDETPSTALSRPAAGSLAKVSDAAAHFPLSPVKEAQIPTIGQDDSILWLKSVPAHVQKDPEFLELFEVGEFVREDDSLPTGEEFGSGHRLSPSAAAIPADVAHARIIALGIRRSLSAARIYELVKLWHKLRLGSEFAERSGEPLFFHEENLLEEYEGEFSDRLTEETPDPDAFRELFEQASRQLAAVEAAKTLALPIRTGNDLEQISAALRVKVAGWLQYGTDRPEYAIALADGRTVVIGPPEAVLNQQRFRKCLYVATGTAFPRMTPDQWLAVCNALGRVRTVGERPGETRRSIFDSVEDYAIAKLDEDRRRAIRDGRSFIDGEGVYVRADNQSEVDQLKASGFRQKTVSVRIGGRVTSRSYWHADADQPEAKQVLARVIEPRASLPSPN